MSILIAGILAGCGQAGLPSLDQIEGKSSHAAAGPESTTATSPITSTTSTATSVSPGGGTDLPPIETYLVSPTTIPSRLKAATLQVTYRSNAANATFECKSDSESDFTPCPDGSTYDFGTLVHDRSYALWVRATDGSQVDDTPLLISFLADLINGQAPGTPQAPIGSGPTAGVRIPTSAVDLPSSGSGGQRVLQVGSFYALIVPADDTVTSYSTNKTTNNMILSLRLLDSPLTTIDEDLACTTSYDKIVPGPVPGQSYCDSTPSDAQWAAETATPAPLNHVEVVHATSASTYDEKVMVAAYDADPDPTESHMDIQASCQGQFYQGTSAVPVLNQFYGLTPTAESFTWCEIKDANNVYWWLGTFGAALEGSSAPAGAPRIRVIYTAAASLGLFSGQQFAERAGQVMPAMIMPIAPAPAQ